MTRDETLAAYRVNEHGRITSPGKFEGEMLYVPALWDAVLDGQAQENDLGESAIEITADDLREFPELGKTKFAVLWESEQGFVYCVEYDSERKFERCFTGAFL